MNKRLLDIVLLLFISIAFMGCSERKIPLSVTFIDVSGAMSADHTINIKFAEEKDFENNFVDILIKTDTDVELTLFKEFAEEKDKVTITLTKDMGFYSLDEHKLFNMEKEQTDSMVGYGEVLATNLVINSNKNATITLKAVLGEKSKGNFKQIGDLSKEYTLNVREKKQ